MTIPRRNSLASDSAQVSRRDQQECQKFLAISHSKMRDPQALHTSSINKPSSASITVCRVLCMPSKHHVTSACVSVSADITLLITPSLRKPQEATTYHQDFFVVVVVLFVCLVFLFVLFFFLFFFCFCLR